MGPGGVASCRARHYRHGGDAQLLGFIGHEGARILAYFSYASGGEADVGADLATLAELVARGQLRPSVGAVIDWHRADQALTALAAGQVAGKAVLTIGHNSTDA